MNSHKAGPFMCLLTQQFSLSCALLEIFLLAKTSKAISQVDLDAILSRQLFLHFDRESLSELLPALFANFALEAM